LASAGEEPNIRLWDVSTASALEVLPPRPGKVLSLTFCGSGRLAAGGSDDLIRIWDVATRSEQLRLVGHTGSVSALAWNSKAELLISGSFDTTVRVWPLRSNIDVISRR
jgi:WD40 repeat protein